MQLAIHVLGVAPLILLGVTPPLATAAVTPSAAFR
jgi:hypothetical protein